ncbi:MAG: glycoside hydrolase family 13 protein [Prevotellaceae bacterium]|jgi:glycosidase|nr:glycoside hydrolase family 13 protein [Prevotellaceae bacterium]
MKNLILSVLSLFFIINAFAAGEIKHVQPAFWWAGMTNPTLQILIHGDKIGASEVLLTSKLCKIDSVARFANKNYLILYVNTQNATPEQFNIILKNGKKKTEIPYELQQRASNARNIKGFDASDVLYLIMPDRFANGDTANDQIFGYPTNRENPNSRHGGDFKGIEKHLDYISDLGVTAIWLNPVLEKNMNEYEYPAYHGYATTDFYKVDARFGTNEDYKNLIAKIHAKGMKTVMDMIFNHCGSENFLSRDLPDSTWINHGTHYVGTTHNTSVQFDKYHSDFDFDAAVDGWFVESMPDFNQRNQHVAKYFIQNSIWWIEYAGLNGIRQDTHPYADYDMMSRWCKEVLDEYPDFNIVGETWLHSNVAIAWWQKDSKLSAPKNSYLKTVMDFPMVDIMENCFDEETGEWGGGFMRIHEYLTQDVVYQNPMNLLVFLDNHDTSRFNKNENDTANIDRTKQALAYILTVRGIPQIYYGAEILMTGFKPDGDGFLRKDFPGGWADDKVDKFTETGRTAKENEVFNFAKNLLNWRKDNEILSKGGFKHFRPYKGVYVYERKYGNRSAVVLFNGTDADQTVETQRYAEILPKTTAKDVIDGSTVNIGKEITVKKRGVVIWEF